ncbi:MAG: bifunctional nuclease family protein [Chitinophagales bacterium]|nr:bifunctional nuclease family protein [Chitinophagales bacterium]
MKKIPLEIIALSHSVTQSHSFAVVLGEVDGTRRLPIVIGGFEAQAIAVALDNMKPSRPLTHDLMKTICDTFSVELDHVFISKLKDGIFFSTLIFTNGEQSYELDSRTSDALALAVRFECPIFVAETILQEAGVDADIVDEQNESELEEKIEELTANVSTPPSSASNFGNMSLEELNEELDAALENEDYERAARIRDELKKRGK